MWTRRVLVAAFGAIAVIVAVGNAFATWRAAQARAQAQAAQAAAFASVELVSQMTRDFTRERLLLDTHIAEKGKLGMERISADIAEADRSFEAAAARYGELMTREPEVWAWRRVQGDLDALRPAIAGVLALSSQDRDTEARRRLEPVDARLRVINSELAGLTELNRDDAERALRHADRLQRSANFIATTLALIAIILVGCVGGATVTLVGHRERRMMSYAGELEQRNRELDAFGGRVAHDLRGPLTTIKLAVARGRIEGPCTRCPAADPIGRSVGRMERLITDLLALSQIETQSRGASCDPAAVAGQVRGELAGRLDAAGATLHVETERATVTARDGLLLQAMVNLVENAVKYARPDTPPVVQLRGRVAGDWYELTIADNGMGMSPDDARRAFEPFYRGQSAQKATGTGLGLSIVKRVVEASGGTVALESVVGRGSTFRLRLPRSA